MSSAAKPTFKQRFIEKTGGMPEHFARDVLRRTLLPHARVLLPVAWLLESSVLAADYDLIADIGQLTSRREFTDTVSVRRYHPANRGFLRKVVRVRVSINRLQKLVYTVMRPADGSAGTPPPFSTPANGNR